MASMIMSLLEPDERETVEFIWNFLNEEDKKGMSEDDVVRVLDAMDDFLEEIGMLTRDEETGDVEYEDGEVDETEQLAFVARELEKEGSKITMAQIQLIMDAEMVYGQQQGWYAEDEE